MAERHATHDADEAAHRVLPNLPAGLRAGERLGLPRLGKPSSQDQLAAEIRKRLAGRLPQQGRRIDKRRPRSRSAPGL